MFSSLKCAINFNRVVKLLVARTFAQSHRLDLHVRGKEHPELGTCQSKFVLLEAEFCPVILIVLSHLSNSNFVALRAALLPMLYNLQLPPPVVLAALVVHASPCSVMQGIVAVFTNI
jgi:hypothetical protein